MAMYEKTYFGDTNIHRQLFPSNYKRAIIHGLESIEETFKPKITYTYFPKTL